MSTTTPQPATLWQLRQAVQAEIDRHVYHAPDSYRLAVNVPRKVSDEIRAKARQRVRAWLAYKLGGAFQVNRLDASDARMALYLLKTNSFDVIREWAKGAKL